MKILAVGHSASRTGAPRSLLNFLTWVRGNTAIDLVIILARDGPLTEQYRALGEVHIWHQEPNWLDRQRKRLRRWLRLRPKPSRRQERIIRAVSRQKPDCIFNNTVTNGPILRVLMQHLRVPLISRIPELEASIQYYNQHRSADLTFQLSDFFIAASRAVKDNLVVGHGLPAAGIDVVYSGVEPGHRPQAVDVSQKYPPISPEDFVVGGCGGIGWRKGTDLFLQVAHELVYHRGHRQLKFLWLGGAADARPLIELQYDLRHYRLEDYVVITGEVEQPTAYYARMNIFVLPSREDPFPLVMLEAARHRLPVIAFRGSGGAEEFLDETVGGCVAYGCPQSMADRVEYFYRHPDQCAAAGDAISRRVEAYTVERASRLMLDIVHQTVARSKKPGNHAD